FSEELSYHKNSPKIRHFRVLQYDGYYLGRKTVSSLCSAETPLSVRDLQALVTIPFRSDTMIIRGLLLPLESSNYQLCTECQSS
ncbi:hypothetical protein N338_02667, partial [Podiceps cristatus]